MKFKSRDFLQLFEQPIQYSVPNWQRRYSWDKATIQQLIKDLEEISKSNEENASHFGGAIITRSESEPPGGVPIYNVVDGQQRLTTISILLACITEKLKETGPTGRWDSEKISSAFLSNKNQPKKLTRKLSLQNEDDEEYECIIEGCPKGKGEVTAAWKVLRSEVDSVGVDCLMKGLTRFKVISCECEPFDDPQQIFESLNATGVPLTEGEKVKNWLLMGSDRETQDRLYLDHWYRLEKSLDAVADPKRIDEFLLDFFRWKTGKNCGIKRTYANLRRWWYDKGGSENKTLLCEELARLAGLYGKITGTNGHHESPEVNELLQYLRDLRIDVHRPFTLRLLLDNVDATDVSEADLAKILRALSTWLTRLWLANARMSGLNTLSISFAYHRISQNGKSYADYWIDKINEVRGRLAVPNEKEIGEGIRKRSAYGGKASKTAKTILWGISSKLNNAANPKIEDLSIEHIIPQNLSKEWWEYLGEDADELWENYVDTLANLTLVGENLNSEISNQIYAEKRKLYQDSTVILTKKLAQSFEHWRKEDIEVRVQELTDLVCKYWPWEDAGQARTVPRWRINGGDWREEKSYRAVLLNVIARLLDLDPLENPQKLSSDPRYRDLLPSDYPPKDSIRYKRIPGYSQYMKNVDLTRIKIIDQCEEFGQQCGFEVEVK